MTTGLARQLRDGTWDLHATTERAGLMPALLRGSLPAADFHRLQRNLHALYTALEGALAAHAGHPLLAPLALAPLARGAVLADDLAQLHGGDWAAALPVMPATQDYVARLGSLARHQPAALVAHAYVRYLGDLSGGQAMSRVVRRTYGLAGAVGTRFFDFGPPDQVAQRSRNLRSALDTLPVDAATAQSLVLEAQWAFAQHARLFGELAAPAA
jgi:heme oxygenase (biliverdin-producing, ferredoxin)